MGLFDWVRRLFAPAPKTLPLPSPLPAAMAGTSPFAAGAGPTRLVILRHAEKSGDRSDPHLSLAGRQRAERLVDYIPATFTRPEFLVGARTSVRSRRPVETLEPLAAALSLEIKAKLDDSEVKALVEALRSKKRYQGKSGIICWRHSDLPRLIAALGAPAGSFPPHWDDDDYTSIIDLTYPGNGEAKATWLRMPF